MSKLTTIAVANSHVATVQRAGRFFPPRTTTVVEVSPSRLAEIRACRYLTVTDAVEDDDAGNGGDGGATARPPESGKGSGIEAWRTYATDVLNLEVDEDATRDDIIAAVNELELEDDDAGNGDDA